MASREQEGLKAVLDHLKGVAPGLADHLQRVEDTPNYGADDTLAKVPLTQRPPALPDFDVLRQIGEGGFGTVWLARNRHDQQLCAVKAFRKEQTFELEGIREYKRRTDDHPNLIPIVHVGESEDFLYYVMPLADDVTSTSSIIDPEHYQPLTLEAYIENHGRVDGDETRWICVQILDGLTQLHDAGAAHRDIKPANILRVRGIWCLGDPGLLTTRGRNTSPTGTRGFFDPNATSAQANDRYALGKTLFMMMTGSPVADFDRWIESEAGRSSDGLGAAVRRACHVVPSERFADTREFRNSLAPRRRFGYWLALLILIVFGAGVWLAAMGSSEDSLVRVEAVNVLAVDDRTQFNVATEAATVPVGFGFRLETRFSQPCHPIAYCLEPDGNRYEIFPHELPSKLTTEINDPPGNYGYPIRLPGVHCILVVLSNEPLAESERESFLNNVPDLDHKRGLGSWTYCNGELRQGSRTVTRQARPNPVAYADAQALEPLISHFEAQDSQLQFAFVLFEAE